MGELSEKDSEKSHTVVFRAHLVWKDRTTLKLKDFREDDGSSTDLRCLSQMLLNLAEERGE